MANAPKVGSNGLAVDAEGNPAIDPTANVLALVLAAVQRQDDLRAAQDRLADAKVEHIKEIVSLRGEYAKENRELDSKRLESIRAVDVLAGDTAARRADEAIRTLASTTAVNAETLRALVAQTAGTLAGQLDQKLASVASLISSLEKSLTDRLASLEKISSYGAGKETLTDPMRAELMAKIEGLAASRNVIAGKTEGSSMVWGVVAAAVGLLVGLGGLIAAVVTIALK